MNDWIKTSEQMPDNGVIVIGANGLFVIGFVVFDKIWRHDLTGAGCAHVTHWMRIPPIPA